MNEYAIYLAVLRLFPVLISWVGVLDLNGAERLMAPWGLKDLNLAERVLTNLRDGVSS